MLAYKTWSKVGGGFTTLSVGGTIAAAPLKGAAARECTVCDLSNRDSRDKRTCLQVIEGGGTEEELPLHEKLERFLRVTDRRRGMHIVTDLAGNAPADDSQPVTRGEFRREFNALRDEMRQQFDALEQRLSALSVHLTQNGVHPAPPLIQHANAQGFYAPREEEKRVDEAIRNDKKTVPATERWWPRVLRLRVPFALVVLAVQIVIVLYYTLSP